jgi:hypothetical protein
MSQRDDLLAALWPLRRLYHEARLSEALDRGHRVSFLGNLSAAELRAGRDAYRALRRGKKHAGRLATPTEEEVPVSVAEAVAYLRGKGSGATAAVLEDVVAHIRRERVTPAEEGS